MDKGLFFMTMALACVWIILDDFFGKKYISTLVSNLIPDDIGKVLPDLDDILPPLEDHKEAEKSKEKAKDKLKDADLPDKTKDLIEEGLDHFHPSPS